MIILDLETRRKQVKTTIEYQNKFTGHDVKVQLKNGDIKHLHVLGTDYAEDNDENLDMLVYQVGKPTATAVGGNGLPIKDIKTIEYDD